MRFELISDYRGINLLMLRGVFVFLIMEIYRELLFFLISFIRVICLEFFVLLIVVVVDVIIVNLYFGLGFGIVCF